MKLISHSLPESPNMKNLMGQNKVAGLIRLRTDPIPNDLKDFFEGAEHQPSTPGLQTLFLAKDKDVLTFVVLSLEKGLNTHLLNKNIAAFAREFRKKCDQTASLWITSSLEENQWTQIVKTLSLSDYQFDSFKSTGLSPEPHTRKSCEKKESCWTLLSDRDHAQALSEGLILGKAIAESRQLVNRPANDLTPTQLALEAIQMARETGLAVEVLGPKDIQKKGLEAYWSVAKGSDEEPRLIILRHLKAPDSPRRLVLVGKGLTYDSGGYDLKSASSMKTMFCDMGGSAAVLQAMRALAENQTIANVVGIIPACESMVSGHAFRNGDIIGSLLGKTIEIESTDAEGRLTLADGVTYAWQKEQADAIVDIATLTGGVCTALGEGITGVMSDSDSLLELAYKASEESGDSVWSLPWTEELAAINQSHRADIRNGGNRMGSASTAGLFVLAFAGKRPFLHLDIAGTAYHASSSENYGFDRGATGIGTELLYWIAKKYFEQESLEKFELKIHPFSDQNTHTWSGGTTTTLFLSPEEGSAQEQLFDLRISSATVDEEKSNFTPMPGVRRIITPLENPMTLFTPDGEKRLETYQIYEFDGGDAIQSQGTGRDFNVMTKGDVKAEALVLGQQEHLSLSLVPRQGQRLFLFSARQNSFKINGQSFHLEPLDFAEVAPDPSQDFWYQFPVRLEQLNAQAPLLAVVVTLKPKQNF